MVAVTRSELRIRLIIGFKWRNDNFYHFEISRAYVVSHKWKLPISTGRSFVTIAGQSWKLYNLVSCQRLVISLFLRSAKAEQHTTCCCSFNFLALIKMYDALSRCDFHNWIITAENGTRSFHSRVFIFKYFPIRKCFSTLITALSLSLRGISKHFSAKWLFNLIKSFENSFTCFNLPGGGGKRRYKGRKTFIVTFVPWLFWSYVPDTATNRLKRIKLEA